MSMMKNLALTLGVLATTAGTASAASVYGTDVAFADWSGSRSGSGQISGDFGTTISWTITQTAGVYHYSYTVTANKNISHLILEVSDTANSDNLSQYVRNVTGGTLTSGDPKQYTKNDGNSNPNLPDPGIYGVKLTPSGSSETFTFTFDSDKAPVWGNFYTKGGQEFAYNSAMDITGFNSSDITKFIARPDSIGAVPEPTSIVMMGLGAVGLIGVAVRRRKARSA